MGMQRRQSRACWLAVLAAMAALAGCGTSARLTAQDEAKVRQALNEGLTAWKKGESAKKWSATGATVRFVDNDWMNGDKLTDYQIVRVQPGVSGPPEAIVRLSLKAARGTVLEREVLYSVSFSNDKQTVVSRDPMY